MLRRFAILLAVAATLWARDTGAQSRTNRDAGFTPHYQSLKSESVHLRVGPGTQHPIDWVLQRRHLPVRVIAEAETWRRIVDSTGTIGWVHQQTLSARRYAIVTGEPRTLRRAPQADAPAVAKLEPGVIGRLFECRDGWCRLEAGGFRGWVARTEIWGVDPGENFK
ncbi:MAG: hypothetical protein JNK67_21280 [Alphaproteobacteria bacterium]|nr:hypothetical protein [Alphaproteobacteria bacterium]